MANGRGAGPANVSDVGSVIDFSTADPAIRQVVLTRFRAEHGEVHRQ